MKVLHLIGIISSYLNISMINYNVFISYRYSLRQDLGSIIELIPMAVIGCIFSSEKILQNQNLYII